MRWRWVRAPLASAWYATLARIDLRGEDAANLHDPRHHGADPALRAHYLSLSPPARELLQIAPLYWHDDPERFAQARQSGERAPGAWRREGASVWGALAALDAASRTMGAGGAPDLEDLSPSGAPPAPMVTRAPELEALLTALYEQLDDTARPEELVVVDVPALRHGPFTHGRCVARGAQRLVALSLDAEPEQGVIQLVHELTHELTDPVVLASWRHDAPRQTGVQGAGFALHQAMERCVVEVDQALIEARAPTLLAAYARWRAMYGV